MRLLAPLFLTLTLVAAPVSAESQLDLNAQEARASQAADATLDATYKKLTADLTPAQRRDLVASQLAWVKFRDAEKAFAGQLAGGGQAASMVASGTARRAAILRTGLLERVLTRRTWQAQSKPPILRDARQRFTLADGELTDHYKKLGANVEKGERAALDKAQKAWLHYRDAECAFELSWRDRTSLAAAKYDALGALTEHRVQDLEAYLDQVMP